MDSWELYRHAVKTCAWAALWFVVFGALGLVIADNGSDAPSPIVAGWAVLAGALGAAFGLATRAQDISDHVKRQR